MYTKYILENNLLRYYLYYLLMHNDKTPTLKIKQEICTFDSNVDLNMLNTIINRFVQEMG